MARQIRWRRLIYWSAGIWSVQATYTTLSAGLINQYSGVETRWLAIAIYAYCGAFTWFLLTPVVYFVIIKLWEKHFSIGKLLVTHIILAFLFSSVQRLLNIGLSYNLIRWTEAVDLSLLKLSNFFGINFLYQVGNGVVTYAIITAILYGFKYFHLNKEAKLKQTELKGRLSQSRMDNLKNQLQPHFLFNSLQSISTLLHRDVKEADSAVADLSDLLRYNLRHIDEERVSLGEEILFLQKFMDIQKRRFTNQISLKIDCCEQLLNTLVPPFILQPVVENSIKHVLQRSGHSVDITLKAYVDGPSLQIEISDDGKEKNASDGLHASGIGLRNLRERLELLYGNQFELSYGYQENLGFETHIRIPCQQK